MHINVKLYQPFKFRDGSNFRRLEVPERLTVSGLMEILENAGVFAEFGRVGAFVMTINDIASEDYILTSDEKVRILPRLAGG